MHDFDYGVRYFRAKNLHHVQLKEAVFEQYEKNALYKVFTKHISLSELPSDVCILRSVPAPSVKSTDIPSIWKLGLQHCVNG